MSTSATARDVSTPMQWGNYGSLTQKFDAEVAVTQVKTAAMDPCKRSKAWSSIHDKWSTVLASREFASPSRAALETKVNALSARIKAEYQPECTDFRAFQEVASAHLHLIS